MAAYTTFCDPGFLDRFYRERPVRDVMEFTDDDRLWLSVHEYLRKETNVVVSSASAESLSEYPFLRYLLDRPVGTSCVLEEEMPCEVDDLSPWTLYMTHDEDVSHQVWRLSPADWRDHWKRLGEHCLVDVCDAPGDRDRLTSWGDLERFHGTLSSVVICDRYMLSNVERAKENVFELIVSLLPHGPVERTIDVTLVTLEVKEINLQKVWDAFMQHLSDRRPEQEVNLTIVKATNLSDYHDRHVFVDYGFLISGHSFNYFKNQKLSVTTTLTYEPALKRSKLAIMLNRLQELATIVQKTPEKLGLYHNVIGNRRNRLLEAAVACGDKDGYSS
jgi:hypothetical protein